MKIDRHFMKRFVSESRQRPLREDLASIQAAGDEIGSWDTQLWNNAEWQAAILQLWKGLGISAPPASSRKTISDYFMDYTDKLGEDQAAELYDTLRGIMQKNK